MKERAKRKRAITVKPPPGSPHFPDQWARQALGDLYPLWLRCGELAQRNDLSFRFVFVAAQELRNEGHAMRDSRILERARKRRDEEQAYSEWIDQRRRRYSDGSTDQSNGDEGD